MDAEAVATVAALDDGLRRALYEFARASTCPVTREDAARAVGISRKLAAHHLDRLVEAHLLCARIGTVGPRRVGRAPKLYEPVREAVSVHIPERQPDLLATVFAEAIGAGGQSAVARALAAAHRRGRDIGTQARGRLRPGRLGLERSRSLTMQLLAKHGFEPAAEDDTVVLRNCPFHPLAAELPELVCGVNREFVRGLTEGLAANRHLDAVLAPRAGRCCVEVRPTR